MSSLRGGWLCACIASALFTTASAGAQPLRLRADALASSASPVGLVVLQGDGQAYQLVSAEALVWLGANSEGTRRAAGDALVVTLSARTTDARVQGKVGRFVAMLGALPPLHVDGAWARVRLPRRMNVEAVLGLPVVPRAAVASAVAWWDWAAGARIGRQLGDYGGVGIAYVERRREGRLDARWVGVDASAAFKQVDASARAVIDPIDTALADLQVGVTRRKGPLRTELIVQHRVASMLLPRTSLFSVLGDIASDRVIASGRLRAAPRLDVSAEGGVRVVDGDAMPEGLVRAQLRLDAKGRGVLQGDVRRQAAIDGGWIGARVALRLPKGPWEVGAEVEVARPDVDRGRGTLWPWGLIAFGRRVGNWHSALAVEGGATPTDRWRVDVLAQLGWQWEAAR